MPELHSSVWKLSPTFQVHKVGFSCMPYVRATKNNYLRNTTNRYKSGIAVTVLNVQQCLHSATANLCNICLVAI